MLNVPVCDCSQWLCLIMIRGKCTPYNACAMAAKKLRHFPCISNLQSRIKTTFHIRHQAFATRTYRENGVTRNRGTGPGTQTRSYAC